MGAADIITEEVGEKCREVEVPAQDNPALKRLMEICCTLPTSPHRHPHTLTGLTAYLVHRRALGSEIIPGPGCSQCPAGSLWPNAA